MNVLVIGGAGYIGSHVAREFARHGHAVTVFDDLSTGSRENLFQENAFIQGSILDTAALDAAFAQGFDAVVHLAALKAAGISMLQPELYSVHNISGTINILNSAVAHSCRILLFASSAAIFGEPAYLPIDEQHPAYPENYYGFTKLEIERILSWYDRLKGLRFAALRFFNAAGYDSSGAITGLEQKPENLLPILMETACGLREKVAIFGTDYPTRDGTCIRDYIHVTDLARAHVCALEYIKAEEKSILVNLGSEQGISVREMLDAARQITGCSIRSEDAARRRGDAASLIASAQYAKTALGWQPIYSTLKTLVETTWKVYQKRYGDGSPNQTTSGRVTR